MDDDSTGPRRRGGGRGQPPRQEEAAAAATPQRAAAQRRPAAAATAAADAPIIVVLTALLGIWGSLFKGAWCAVRGTILALRNPECRRVHRHILLPLAAIAIPTYALLVLPARVLLAALRFKALAAALSRYSAAAARLAALGINLALRFIFYTPLDRAYLSVLSDLDPNLARELAAVPARSYKEAMWKEARRLVRLLSFLPLYIFLSLIPVFGRLLKWAFKVGKRCRRLGIGWMDGWIDLDLDSKETDTHHKPSSKRQSKQSNIQVYTLSKVLPSPAATFAVALLSLLPFVDTPTTLLLQAYLAQVRRKDRDGDKK